jgi:hypothetical protein
MSLGLGELATDEGIGLPFILRVVVKKERV